MNILDSSVLLAFVVPSQVIWSYSVGGSIFLIGLVLIFVRGDWMRARGFDKLLLFGPLFYAAPIAAFGTEHFTLTAGIESVMPKYIPWHLFWVYLVGACFIAGALSLVTRVQAQLAASLLAFTFFMFVMLMYLPGSIRSYARDLHNPQNRFILTVALRETCFSGGAMALAVALSEQRDRAASIFANVARYFVAVPILFFSLEQFLHGEFVPGIPLQRLTPDWLPGHSIWTYIAAAAYVVPGIMLLAGRKPRAAATVLGATVLFIEIVVYLPIGVHDLADLGKGLNYVMDTLMFCGAVLLLAGAMPRESEAHASASAARSS